MPAKLQPKQPTSRKLPLLLLALGMGFSALWSGCSIGPQSQCQEGTYRNQKQMSIAQSLEGSLAAKAPLDRDACETECLQLYRQKQQKEPTQEGWAENPQVASCNTSNDGAGQAKIFCAVDYALTTMGTTCR